MVNSSGSPVRSIDRVLDVIEALSNQPHGVTLTNLSSKVGLHISTTHRLLSSLTARGYVQQDKETGKYRLTMRLFEIGSRIIGGMNLVSISRPYLERLAELTNEAIHLVARDGDEVVYLYKEDMRESIVSMASFVGMRAPMYSTAVGKSILARMSENEVKDIWNRIVVIPFTKNTITHYDALLRELQITRERGWAVDNEENEPGVLCVGASIIDFSGTPIGAISVSGPVIHMSEEKRKLCTREVVESARAISGLLGFQDNP